MREVDVPAAAVFSGLAPLVIECVDDAGEVTALRIRLSRHTAIRSLLRIPLPPQPVPRVLGVDDFALRRRHRYATVRSTPILISESMCCPTASPTPSRSGYATILPPLLGAATTRRTTVPAEGRLETIRLVPTRANGQLAVAAIDTDNDGQWRPYGLMVFDIRDQTISRITGFPSCELSQRPHCAPNAVFASLTPE